MELSGLLIHHLGYQAVILYRYIYIYIYIHTGTQTFIGLVMQVEALVEDFLKVLLSYWVMPSSFVQYTSSTKVCTIIGTVVSKVLFHDNHTWCKVCFYFKFFIIFYHSF